MRPVEREDELERAWEALEAGANEDALRLARAALQKEPDASEPAELEARALAALGRLADALARLEARAAGHGDEAWPHTVRADLLLRADEPDVEAARAALKAAARRARREPFERAEIAWLEGVAHLLCEEDARAFDAFSRALEENPDHDGARLDRGLLAFELGKLDQACADLEPLTQEPFDVADAWHALGLIAERRGEDRAAKQALARATRLDPVAFPPPVELSEAEFDRAVKEALGRLPDFARAAMDNVTIAVAPIPSDEDLDGGALSPSMLGVFQGTPRGARSLSSAADHATAQIVLFQNNLQRFARSRSELVEQIGVTVAHEVGHLLGLDEDDLEERGLE